MWATAFSMRRPNGLLMSRGVRLRGIKRSGGICPWPQVYRNRWDKVDSPKTG